MAITELTFAPTSPRVGDPVVFTVMLSPSTSVTSTTQIAAGTVSTLELHAFAKEQNNRNVALNCADGVSQKLIDQTTPITYPLACRVTFPAEGDYRLVVTLTQYLTPTGIQTSTFTQQSFVVSPYATALPDQVARLFASFGLFAAIMVVMALATEVIIDNLKVALGLKSKVTAMDAFKDMERLLPGKLANLGVGAADQERVQIVINDLTHTLASAGTVSSAFQTVANGNLADILKTVSQTSVLDQTILSQIKPRVTQAWSIVKTEVDKLGLPPEILDPWVKAVSDKIDTLSTGTVVDYLNVIASEIQKLGHGALANWLNGMLGNGKPVDEVLGLFDSQVAKMLEAIGWTKEQIKVSRNKLAISLKTIVSEPLLAAQTYVKSLDELLQGVEDRRYATQSPLRKLWRRLRRGKFGTLAISLLVGIVIALFLLISWGKNDSFDFQPKLDFMKSAWLLVFVISFWPILGTVWGGIQELRWLLKWLYLKAPALIQVPVNFVGNFKLGNWLLNTWYKQTDLVFSIFSSFVITIILTLSKNNWLDLVKGTGGLAFGICIWVVFAVTWGLLQVLGYKRVLIVQTKVHTVTTPESVAKTMLLSSDKHRDEEDSRLRWLRVLAAFIGTVLAYLLQVDATKVLATAIPGISNVVNLVIIKGPALHKFWSVFSDVNDLTPGIILTGLAASAGSAFWHDQLDRLQATKNSAEQAMALVNKAKGIASGETIQ